MTEKTIRADDEEAILAAARKIEERQRAEARDKTVATFKPLLDLMASPEFSGTRQQLSDLAPSFEVASPSLHNAMKALAAMMDNLGRFVPLDARPILTGTINNLQTASG